MPISTEPFDLQTQQQRDGREKLEAQLSQTEAQLVPWPALRDAVSSEVLPALQRWRHTLAPFRGAGPRRRYIRRLRYERRRLVWLPHLALAVLRLRMQILALRIALIWMQLVRWLLLILILVALLALVRFALTHWDQIREFIAGLPQRLDF